MSFHAVRATPLTVLIALEGPYMYDHYDIGPLKAILIMCLGGPIFYNGTIHLLG